MAKGTGRTERLALLGRLTAGDPDLRQQLLALRHYNPQAYRRKLKALGREVNAPSGGTSKG